MRVDHCRKLSKRRPRAPAKAGNAHNLGVPGLRSRALLSLVCFCSLQFPTGGNSRQVRYRSFRVFGKSCTEGPQLYRKRGHRPFMSVKNVVKRSTGGGGGILMGRHQAGVEQYIMSNDIKSCFFMVCNSNKSTRSLEMLSC
jgi:hypothetical protein